MLQLRQCLRCKHTFAEGDLVKHLLPKCPHCDSRLTVPKLKNDSKLWPYKKYIGYNYCTFQKIVVPLQAEKLTIMDKQIPTQSKPIPPLWLCILLDIIGMLSYIIPGMGEWMDTVWAPISACLFGLLFGGTKGTIIAFLEEALPFTDIIPTFTITYFLRKRKANKAMLKKNDNLHK